MLLTSTSDIIRVVTSTQCAVDVQTSWADITTSTFSPGRTNSKIIDAVTTTIIGAPASASMQRQVKTLMVKNVHATTAVTVTVQHYDGTISVEIYKRALLAGESFFYGAEGWQPFNATGEPVVAGGGGSGVSDHVDLDSLAWTSAGHTGTGVAAFDGGGAASLMAVGSASGTLAAGNDGRFPTADQKAAMGAAATPTASNAFATIADIETELTVTTKTASHLLVLGDARAYVRMSVGSANDVTVQPNATVAFPVGTTIQVRQVGAGQTTIVAGIGVTVNTSETLLLRAQGSTVSLVKVDTNEWDLTGDVEFAA